MTADEFNQKQEEILERLPSQLRNAISWLAWDRGHAYGYEEVLNHVLEMVDALEQPVLALMDDVKKV